MSDMQIKMVAYLYLIGIVVDLVWEILKLIESKEYIEKTAYETLSTLPITEKTINAITIILTIVVLALYSGAWPFSMHIDIWTKSKAE